MSQPHCKFCARFISAAPPESDFCSPICRMDYENMQRRAVAHQLAMANISVVEQTLGISFEQLARATGNEPAAEALKQNPYPENTWEHESWKWRGRVLTGVRKHYCHDWDGLPIDETCPEWPCACASLPESWWNNES